MTGPNKDLNLNKLKIALVYDQLTKIGGAERLIKNILEILPATTDIYTPKYIKNRLPFWANRQIKTSFLSKPPFSFLPYQLHLNLSRLVVENFDFSSYDLVFSLGNTLAKGVITKTSTNHLNYAFAPSRFLWQDYHLFQKNLSPSLKFLFSIWSHNQRSWDYIASQRPDKIITLSQFSQFELAKYYHRSAEVVYPPFDFSYWLGLKAEKINLPFNKFFLAVGRLVPQKRIDISISAALKSGSNLIVVGQGWLKGKLEQIAGRKKNIIFLNSVTDGQLKYLYQKCQGLIGLQSEDFGYVFLEAAVFYKPILVFKTGGQMEILAKYPEKTILNQQNSVLLARELKKISRKNKNFTSWPESNKMKRFFKPFQKKTFQVKLKGVINQLMMKGNK